jgi:hypothetical protein
LFHQPTLASIPEEVEYPGVLSIPFGLYFCGKLSGQQRKSA